MHFTCSSKAILLQVALHVELSLLNLTKALNIEKYIVLPHSLNRLVHCKVSLLARSILLTIFEGTREEYAILLVHYDTLPIHLVLFEHTHVTLKQLNVFKLAKAVILAVAELTDVFLGTRGHLTESVQAAVPKLAFKDLLL